MTIVAGFKFEKGVVLCADTQETIGNVMKNQVPKLRVERRSLKVSNMAVAFCGATDNGPFVDKLVTLAWEKAQKANDLDDACQRIDQSIKDTHEEFGSIFQIGYMPNTDLIFGVTMQGSTRLFQSTGPVVNEKHNYAVAGVGMYLANFLISRMYTDWLTANQCVILAAYVLFQTKEHVEGCGGDSHIALLRNDKSSGLVDGKYTEEITELCKYGDFEGGRMMRSMADMECGHDEFEEEVKKIANLLRYVREHRIPRFKQKQTDDQVFNAKVSNSPLEDFDIFGLPTKMS